MSLNNISHSEIHTPEGTEGSVAGNVAFFSKLFLSGAESLLEGSTHIEGMPP